jgi:hypothetical protein
MTDDELATEEWIRNRWGGFNHLVIGRNEDFSLYFIDGPLGALSLVHEDETSVDVLLLFEKPTKQKVIDAERIFGIEIKTQ